MLLAIVAFMTLVAVAVSAFADVNLKATRSYNNVRATRYSADAAIKSATNWIADNDDVAVDPIYKPDANEDCVYHSTATTGEVITVSCESEPGSGGGIPGDVGLNPPEAIFLTGDRHNEPGPYSYAKCVSYWSDLVDFFTGETPGTSESGLYTKRRERSTWGGIGDCDPKDRGTAPLTVEGNVVSAGKISLQDGFKLHVGGGDSGGVVRAQFGCEFSSGGNQANSILNLDGSAPADSQCNVGTNPKRNGPPDTGMPWFDTYLFKDPGRISSSTTSTAATPIGDVRDAFLPVGFDADGSLKSGYTLPTRDKAYVYDPNANTSGTADEPKFLKPWPVPSDGGGCTIPNGTPVVFLWGRYTSSEVLNRYTANPECTDVTFWFAPNPGPDKTLLTGDDLTAAFYMDFSDTSAASACGGMEGLDYARWCLGGSSELMASKPRVVVGWPKDWTALPTEDPGGSGSGGIGYGNRVGAYLDTAGAIEGNFLSYWSNTSKATKVDTEAAVYKPCAIPVFWWVINCPSFGSRTMRLAKFTPKVAGGPIAETGNPDGLINVDVTFAMNNASGLTPKVLIDYLGPTDTVAKSCQDPDKIALGQEAFTLEIDPVLTTFSGGPVPATSKGTLSAADQQILAENCGAVDAINNMRVTFMVEGNPWNTNSPTIYLDGVRIHYDSYQGASFPLPVDDDGNIQPIGTGRPEDPAKSDCDTTKPGGQLIFGGESHVYAADGSLEVCGGPNPDDPDGSLVIGIYGVPAVEPLRPSSVTLDTGSSGSSSTTFSNPDAAKRIGEPVGVSSATIRYPGECWGAVGFGWCHSPNPAKEVVAQFPPFPAIPSGYKVSTIGARVSYSNEGPLFESSNDVSQLKVGGCTENARTTSGDIRQWANEGRKSASRLVLYEAGTSRNCLSPSTLTGGSQVRWRANTPDGINLFTAQCVLVFIYCNYTQTDSLEGLELDVSITPTATNLSSPSDTSTPILRPQTGCIVSHPNYDGGEADPDCALVRADSYTADGADSPDGGLCLGTCPGRRTNWFGRVSVKGTIYAPSSAVEIDDNDIGYPLATRGMILRHLRVSGSRPRVNYTDPLIGGKLDKVPADRAAVLTACVQTAGRRSADEVCDASAGDRTLARSGVVFTVDPNHLTDPLPKANVPKVRWYSDEVSG